MYTSNNSYRFAVKFAYIYLKETTRKDIIVIFIFQNKHSR